MKRIAGFVPVLAFALLLTGVAETVNVRIGLEDAGNDFEVICPQGATVSSPSLRVPLVIEPDGKLRFHKTGDPSENPVAREIWRLQIHAARDPGSAERAAKEAQRKLGPGISIYVEPIEQYFKVRVGDFGTREEAMAYKPSLEKKGYPSFPVKILVCEEGPPIADVPLAICAGKGEVLVTAATPIAIQPQVGFLALRNRTYRGRFEVRVDPTGKIVLVNDLDIDDYLMGVVPSEVHHSLPAEALKAQAVAARSEILAKLGRHSESGFDFCDQEHCQRYRGMEREETSTNAAVKTTAGEVLYYRGEIIDAVYSASCGGITESNQYVWDGKAVPYLQGHLDADKRKVRTRPPLRTEGSVRRWVQSKPRCYCAVQPKHFRWQVSFSTKELGRMVNAGGYDIGTFKDMRVVKRGVSGRIRDLDIIGSKRTVRIHKELNIRRLFGGLKSSCFWWSKKGGRYYLFGAGRGHGCGMCQDGIWGMALAGFSYRQMLAHYYPGSEIRIYRP